MMRQAENNMKRYVQLAALNFPISRPLDAGLLSKVFLRNSLGLPQGPEPISKFLTGIFVHSPLQRNPCKFVHVKYDHVRYDQTCCDRVSVTIVK